MTRPVVALLTDFGTVDHYAGTMKGVVLDVCPETSLVDITHDIAPHDVLGGALELAACCRYFPSGTTFLVVVDPGVGSARRGIAAAGGGYTFVAPDNGVIAPALDVFDDVRVIELTEFKYARPTVSRTFEGRDRFAPAAGWLARGIALAALGRPLASWERLAVPDAVEVDGGVDGEVIRVDRFGNLVTNVGRGAFERLVRRGAIELSVGGHPVARVVETYADADGPQPVAIFGSADTLEVAVGRGSAAAQLGLRCGAPVCIRRV